MRPELRVSVVRDETAACSPDCSMGDALQKLKWEHQPGPGDEGDVDEPDDVAKQSNHQYLQIIGEYQKSKSFYPIR